MNNKHDEKYDEMIKDSVQKISERSRREFDYGELIYSVYKEILSGSLKLEPIAVEMAVRKRLGDAGLQCLAIKIDQVYTVLKHRLMSYN